MIRALVAFERAAAAAVIARDRGRLAAALCVHPSFADIPVSTALIDDIVASRRAWTV